MKMIRLIVLGIVATMTFTNFQPAETPLSDVGDKYDVDLENSKIRWKGKKLVGYAHEGILKLSKSALTITDSQIESAFFEIDMNSLMDDDAIENPNELGLTNHLKSEDFFHVEKFPTATIRITSSKPISNNPDAGDRNFILTGDLTIKGITKKIGFPAAISMENGSFSAKATIKFDRSKWNIKYGSGSFFDDLGDDMISDDIELQVEIVAKEAA